MSTTVNAETGQSSATDVHRDANSSNRSELLLFKLGANKDTARSEQYGISVFKVREIVPMPKITQIAGSLPNMLGIVNIRGQIIPVIDLPAILGCKPATGANVMLVTEFARSIQAFAVESVDEIVHLDWSQILPAEQGVANGTVTSIARLDADLESSRLVQVLDVEAIVGQFAPAGSQDISPDALGAKLELKPGSAILAADDSAVARSMIERSLEIMGAPCIMTKSGMEAWDRMRQMADESISAGERIQDRIAMVLTDLEMPELDGFTLTQNIKNDPRFASIPVVVYSSLTGTANEAHAKSVGADAYVAKFAFNELAETLRQVAQR